MNLPSQVYFNDVNHGYRAAILKKNSLWLLPFYRVVATISIMKRWPERCPPQLYQTSLICMLRKKGGICLVSETKLDYSFPSVQFKIEGFTNLYKYDQSDKRGGRLLYSREDIPWRFLQCKSQCNIESYSVERNLRKRKWFLNCSYNLHIYPNSRHLECLTASLMNIVKPNDNLVFIGDFNVGSDENSCDKIFVI